MLNHKMKIGQQVLKFLVLYVFRINLNIIIHLECSFWVRKWVLLDTKILRQRIFFNKLGLLFELLFRSCHNLGQYQP